MNRSTGSGLYVRLFTNFPHDIDITKFMACDLTHQRDTVADIDVSIRTVNGNSGFLSILIKGSDKGSLNKQKNQTTMNNNSASRQSKLFDSKTISNGLAVFARKFVVFNFHEKYFKKV